MSGARTRRALVLVLAVGGAATACKSKGSGLGSSRPLGLADGPLAAETFVAAAAALAHPPYGIAKLRLEFVRIDGQVDPSYGSAIVTFGAIPTTPIAPADDPKRPLGAPVIDAGPVPSTKPKACDRVTWKASAFTTKHLTYCDDATVEVPRCTIAKLWQLAIADGAPANALATFWISTSSRYAGDPHWMISIEDTPRGYHFEHAYGAAACSDVVSTVVPAEAGSAVDAIGRPDAAPADIPAEVDRAAIMRAITTARPAITACAPTGTGALRVKATLTVQPSGAVGNVAIAGASDDTVRACLEAALRTATFPRSATVTTFTYPILLTGS